MDQVEEIKQKIDIVDLVGSYLDLKKAGANWKASCPFHQEKTPSFMVNPDRGIFKCFGCGEGGDIFTFIERMEGMDFPEALRLLAERAGVKLERIDRKFYDQKRILFEINNLASKVYHHLLTKEKVGKTALRYLGNRGLKKKIIDEFELGYAPNNFEFISNYLLKKGFKQNDILNSGLSLESRQQKNDQLPIFDRFRGRIMFPLTNPGGNIVGFSGRLLYERENEGKYINTPETPIFSKSRIIFGYDKARSEIRKKGFLVLAEGQMDVVLSHQAGFKNTVATGGTALTEDQIQQLARICKKFIFAFDKDIAGAEATKRGVDLSLKSEVDVLIVTPPKGFKDAAEVIQNDRSLWTKALKRAVPYIDYLFELAFSGRKKDLSPQEKRDISTELLPEIAKLENPILIGEYVSKLAAQLGTQEKYLYEAIEKYSSQQKAVSSQQKEGLIRSQFKQTSRENHLLGLILVFSDEFKEMKKTIRPSDFKSDMVKTIYTKLCKWYSKRREFDLGKFISSLKKDEQDFVNLAVLDVANEYQEKDEDLAREEITEIMSFIKKESLAQEKEEFEDLIKKAEERGDRDKVKELIRNFQNLVIKK